MRLRPRDYTLLAITTVFSVTCISLGLWQLRRLAARRASNANVIAHLALPPVSLDSLPRDSAALHYRRVVVDGAYDYAHETRIVERTRNGSPGVNIVTPVRRALSDTALLVTRGWVYAPDGVTVDLTPWREGDSVRSVGYARPFERALPGDATLHGVAGALRWMDRATLARAVPYPVYPFVVVLAGDTTPRAHVPPRVPPPPLDEGPHMSYAIQWFSFALIAIVGTFFFITRATTPRDVVLRDLTEQP